MSITPQISNTLANLNGVAFPDTCHGWAEGYIEKGDRTRVGIIVATSDGGATWAEIHETTMTLRDIAFPNILNGWVVGGDPPTILATADGGGTWTPQTSGIEDDPGVTFLGRSLPGHPERLGRGRRVQWRRDPDHRQRRRHMDPSSSGRGELH